MRRNEDMMMEMNGEMNEDREGEDFNNDDEEFEGDTVPDIRQK